MTLHRIEDILAGDLDEMLDSIHDQMAARAVEAVESA